MQQRYTPFPSLCMVPQREVRYSTSLRRFVVQLSNDATPQSNPVEKSDEVAIKG